MSNIFFFNYMSVFSTLKYSKLNLYYLPKYQLLKYQFCLLYILYKRDINDFMKSGVQ